MYSLITNKSAVWARGKDAIVSALVIKRALSSPNVLVFPEKNEIPFPKELQERAAAVKQLPAPEPSDSQMCFVLRRERMVVAEARYVYLEGSKKI